jgi:heme-degrading monooxygenase HmoA
MNYALLRKYRYAGDSQELDKVFAQVTRTLLARKTPGCYEVLLYVSENEPNVFFAMSLWFSLEELEAVFMLALTLEQVKGILLLEQKVFELVEEYRQLDTKIEASFMRLISHNKALSISQLLKSTPAAISKSRQTPGYIGGWVGLCRSDPQLILTKTDWSSHNAFRAFLEDKSPDSLVKWYFSHGVTGENASYDLRVVISFIP